jgi:translation initiation factor 2A
LTDAEKRKRTIEQKLQQIAALKKKQQAGQTLDHNQIEKLKTEQSLRDELAKLTI